MKSLGEKEKVLLIKAVFDLLAQLNSSYYPSSRRRPVKLVIRRGYTSRSLPDRIHKLVGTVRDVQIHIWPNDHNPPHFHAKSKSGKFDIRVSIETNTVISTKLGKMDGKTKRIIEEWSENNNNELWRAWNETRPTELSVKS